MRICRLQWPFIGANHSGGECAQVPLREPRGIIDSQSVRTTGVGGVRGYDGAKRVNGRKRHILVDSGAWYCAPRYTRPTFKIGPASRCSWRGADDQFPRVEHLWVDQGYTGSGKSWIEENLGWRVEAIRHPPHPRGEWVPHGDLARIETVRFSWQRLPPGAKVFRGVLPRRLGG